MTETIDLVCKLSSPLGEFQQGSKRSVHFQKTLTGVLKMVGVRTRGIKKCLQGRLNHETLSNGRVGKEKERW